MQQEITHKQHDQNHLNPELDRRGDGIERTQIQQKETVYYHDQIYCTGSYGNTVPAVHWNSWLIIISKKTPMSHRMTHRCFLIFFK